MALPSRLSSTCRRCRPSSTTRARHVGGDAHRQPQPFPLGRFGDDVREVGRSASRDRSALSSMSSRPASIFERSSTSLIRSSSCEPHLEIASSASRCVRVQARDRAAGAGRSRARRSAASAARGSCWPGTRSWRASPPRPTPWRGAARRPARGDRRCPGGTRRRRSRRRRCIGDVMVSSTGNSRPDRCRAVSSRRWLTTGASPVS